MAHLTESLDIDFPVFFLSSLTLSPSICRPTKPSRPLPLHPLSVWFFLKVLGIIRELAAPSGDTTNTHLRLSALNEASWGASGKERKKGKEKRGSEMRSCALLLSECSRDGALAFAHFAQSIDLCLPVE